MEKKDNLKLKHILLGYMNRTVDVDLTNSINNSCNSYSGNKFTSINHYLPYDITT